MVASHQRSASREVCHHNRGVAGMETMRNGYLPVANSATCALLSATLRFWSPLHHGSWVTARRVMGWSPRIRLRRRGIKGSSAKRQPSTMRISPDGIQKTCSVKMVRRCRDPDGGTVVRGKRDCSDTEKCNHSVHQAGFRAPLPGCHHDRIIVAKSQEEQACLRCK